MNMRVKRKRRRRWKKRIIATAGFLIIGELAVMRYQTLGPQEKLTAPRIEIIDRSGTVEVQSDWNLILVNDHNYMPDNYEIELTQLSNEKKVDTRIYPYLQEMFDAARQNGIYPVVRDGYRTAEEQQSLLENKIQAYVNEGYSQESAEELAKQWVALPGTSEHQLGIAVDINADTSRSTSEDVYNWFAANAYQYGFIQRYPPEKTGITGIAYEPWHYRYVGKEAAEKIYANDMCLEEYINTLQ